MNRSIPPSPKNEHSTRTGARRDALPSIGATVASLLVLFGTGCRPAAEQAETPAVRVEAGQVIVEKDSPEANAVTVEMARPPAAVALRLNGRLVWDENVTTRLFTPFAGRVTQIAAEIGETVSAGQPLVFLASPEYGQAQAEAQRAITELTLTERALNRTRELFDHGAAPQKDLQSAEADVERARLERRRTADRLALYGGAEDHFDQVYVLKAPLAGVVVEKNLSPGAEVRSDQMLANTPQLAAPLFVLTDPTRLWIVIDVPERDQGQIHVGQTFQLPAANLTNLTCSGRIETVADSLDPTTHTLKARGSVANPDRRLKAEMFVKVEIPRAPDSGAEVPSRAVFLRGEKHCLLVEQSPGRYIRRDVSLGEEQAGRVVITAGLAPGERVVTEGTMLLKDLLDKAPDA